MADEQQTIVGGNGREERERVLELEKEEGGRREREIKFVAKK